MSTQSAHEMEDAKLSPSEDGQPPTMVQYDASTDPHVGLGGGLEKLVDQAGSQDPSPQDNPQPLDANQGASNVEENSILGLPFPRKLWRIVEDEAFLSVHWNEAGNTVIIEEYLFQSEILCRKGKEKIFESDSLKTFIRLMNLHGFNKIRPDDSSVSSPRKKIMIYVNSNFQRVKPWLLKNIKPKGNWMTRASPGSSATPAKRNKNAAPTRQSSRLHRKTGDEEDERKAQRSAKKAQGPSDSRSFKFSAARRRSSAIEVQGPSEAGVPSGEGTPGNIMFVPTATSGTPVSGDLPTSPPNDPLHGSVISLQNICSSTRVAGLPVLAPPGDPDEDEDKEEGSP